MTMRLTGRLGENALGLAGMAGPAVMLLGMLLFAVNDAMGKWLVASYGLGQVILIRSVAALLVLAPFLWAAGLKPIVEVERRASSSCASSSRRWNCSVFTTRSCICHLPTS